MDRLNWDRLASTYDQEVLSSFDADRSGIIGRRLDKLDGAKKTALDLGCGVGKYIRPLADRFGQVVGANHSDELLKIARRDHGNLKNVDIRMLDATRKRSAPVMRADVVVCANVLIMADDGLRAAILDTARKSMVPDGRLGQRVRRCPTMDARAISAGLVGGGETRSALALTKQDKFGHAPCALLNLLPHDFSGNVFVNGNYDPANIWTADATVVIERQRNSSDTIIGAIRGGSVCELYAGTATVAPMLPCSVNESLISFTITGGTGRYANYGGSGSLRAVVNTCAVGGRPYDLVSASPVHDVDPADAVVLDQISLRIER